MPEARVNGARIWYKETGKGDPVVQIHGAGFGHFNFATATPILSNSFRCIDFDMRGYGQSERPFQRYDMEVWADDVAGLMDHIGLRKAHIHGTSMGGMVAQQFAAKYPERTQRLTVSSTSLLPSTSTKKFCSLSRGEKSRPHDEPGPRVAGSKTYWRTKLPSL